MKRLFITTDVSKIESMYNRSGHEERKNKVSRYFFQLPKEFAYNDELKIVVLKDNFVDWASYKINKESDYILYHRTSEKDVVESIHKTFNNYKDGQHVLNELHDQVFRIIFDDKENDKATKVLQAYGFDPEEESLTEAIFAAIYEKKSEDEIEAAIKIRDKHLVNKSNRR